MNAQEITSLAEKRLAGIRGLRSSRLWISESESGAELHAEIAVRSAKLLPSVVSQVADDLVIDLERLYGSTFARHDLNFSIAAMADGEGPTQTLTLT